MIEFQRRVLQEREDLSEKVQKLKDFLKTSPVKVEADERTRLESQYTVMVGYLAILDSRITAFTKVCSKE